MDELGLISIIPGRVKISNPKDVKKFDANATLQSLNDQTASSLLFAEGDEDSDLDDYGDGQGDSADFYKYFPQFNWVVRDLSLDFQHLTPKSYLL